MRFIAKNSYQSIKKTALSQYKNSLEFKSLKNKKEDRTEELEHLISARKLKKSLNSALFLFKKNKKAMSRYLKKMQVGK